MLATIASLSAGRCKSRVSRNLTAVAALPAYLGFKVFTHTDMVDDGFRGENSSIPLTVLRNSSSLRALLASGDFLFSLLIRDGRRELLPDKLSSLESANEARV
jgi:hypothetical protein